MFRQYFITHLILNELNQSTASEGTCDKVDVHLCNVLKKDEELARNLINGKQQ